MGGGGHRGRVAEGIFSDLAGPRGRAAAIRLGPRSHRVLLTMQTVGSLTVSLGR